MQVLFHFLVIAGLVDVAHGERGMKVKSPIMKAALELLSNEPLELRRLPHIERGLEESFSSIPKNALGQVPIKGIAPALIRSYFAKESGWMIRGLEPPTLMPHITQLHEPMMLQDKTPDFARLLKEAHDAGRGLVLAEIAAVIAVLERLILDETAFLMRGAYFLNSIPTDAKLNSSELHEVLLSYLVVFRSGSNRNLTNIKRHQRVKAVLGKRSARWKKLVKWEREVEAASVEPDGRFTFAMANQLAKNLTQRFGRYQDDECYEMKGRLMNVSTAPGSGQVLYNTFHTQPKNPRLKMTESAEYLRSMGALDDSDPSAPKVLIPNYLLGPSNCIASSTYFGICCLSECERVRGAIENVVLAPQVSPDELLEVMGGMATSTVEAPRAMTADLEAGLRAIARQHEGVVPLHSSDYAQWLHHAFPNECPRPTAHDSAAEDSGNAIVQGWATAISDTATGCTGEDCDNLARAPLWYENLWPQMDLPIDPSAHEL